MPGRSFDRRSIRWSYDCSNDLDTSPHSSSQFFRRKSTSPSHDTVYPSTAIPIHHVCPVVRFIQLLASTPAQLLWNPVTIYQRVFCVHVGVRAIVTRYLVLPRRRQLGRQHHVERRERSDGFRETVHTGTQDD